MRLRDPNLGHCPARSLLKDQRFRPCVWQVVYSAMTTDAHGACAHLSCGWDVHLLNCVRTTTYVGFNSLLLGLQALQLFWGWKVVGVLATVLRGKPLEDPRDEE